MKSLVVMEEGYIVGATEMAIRRHPNLQFLKDDCLLKHRFCEVCHEGFIGRIGTKWCPDDREAGRAETIRKRELQKDGHTESKNKS